MAFSKTELVLSSLLEESVTPAQLWISLNHSAPKVQNAESQV